MHTWNVFQNVTTNKMLNSKPATHIPKLIVKRKLHASNFFTNIDNSLFISMCYFEASPWTEEP
jgi:hypothetical protein